MATACFWPRCCYTLQPAQPAGIPMVSRCPLIPFCCGLAACRWRAASLPQSIHLTCHMPRIHSCTVTPAILATATKTLEEVRAAIRQLMAGGDTVMVGHSLESDLHAMRLSLPDGACVLDTALLYPLRCNLHGPPAKAALRNLTVQHLKREIQQPRMEPGVMNVGMGHSPAEDAQAAMDLAVLKLANGHSYATPDASWGIGFERMDMVRLPHESTDLALISHRLAFSKADSHPFLLLSSRFLRGQGGTP
jgi:hypothetical protein